MKKIKWVVLGGCLVLLIVAHGILIVWYVKLSDRMGGWFPSIAGGALMAFGLYHVIGHLRGKGRGHSHFFGGHTPDREEVEHGPHGGFLVNLGHGFVEITIFETDVPPRFRLFFFNQHRQARSVPAHATITIETVRHDDVCQTFTFRAQGEYLESTDDISEPHEFKAILRVSHGSHTHAPHEVQF